MQKRPKAAAPPGLPLALAKGRGTGRKRKKPASEDISGSSLFEIVKSKGDFVSEAAREWLLRYEANKEVALAELLTMLFQACGSRYIMKDAGTDVDEAVETMVAEAKMGNLDDSIGSKKGDVRTFKGNLETFWDALVLECQDVALFDQYLMDKVMDFVIAISCTPPRNFRNVATVVGLQLVSSFVSLASKLSRSRETAQRQLNAERKKGKDGPRATALAKAVAEAHDKITQVEEMMRKIHTGLFMHRYRDKDENIRICCITSIGSWIATYPSMFLQELYLKYLGFPLNDKKPNVRNSAILALQELYSVDAYIPSLALFTTRFCRRMVELADDVDVGVAVNAIGLLKQLFKHQLLPDEYLSSLFDLLIDDQAQIRHAVGDLVFEHLVLQNASSEPSTSENPVEAELDRILQILREFSADPILSDYVIDAIWEKSKAMKDWKFLVSTALDEKSENELTEADATNLIRVILASAKKSVGEKIVPSAEVRSTDHRRSALNRAQKEAMEAAKSEMTSVMIQAYPKLLRKYMVDRGKVTAIAGILMYMDLELFSLKRKEQDYAEAVRLLKEAFLKHGDEATLKACMKALAFAVNESHAVMEDVAHQVLSETVDDLTAKLQQAIRDAGNSEDEYSLTANLRRLRQLLLVVPVPSETLYDEMLGLLSDFSYMDDEVIQLLLLNLFLLVVWSLKAIDADHPDELAVQALITKRTRLLDQLKSFAVSVSASWEGGNPRSLLSCTICVVLSDLWCLFSLEKLAPTRLHELGISPEDEFLQQFWKLCQQRLSASDNADDVFAEEQSDFLDEKVVIISAAAKLVANRMIPKDFLGPEIVSHLALHDKIVSETVKELVTSLREQEDVDDVCYLYLEGMKRAHGRFIDQSEDDESAKDSYNSCKELALRLAATFKRTAKTTILKIVKGGIDYAFKDPPKHLTFLEVGVIQFAAKLTSADLRPIHDIMMNRMQGINTDEDPSGWRPCLVFLQYLKEKCAIADVSAEKGFRRGKRRVAAIKGGKKLFEGVDTSDEENAEPLDNASSGSPEDDDDDDEDRTAMANIRNSSTARQRAVRARTSKEAASTSPTNSAPEQNQRRPGDAVRNVIDYGTTATEEQLPHDNDTEVAGNHPIDLDEPATTTHIGSGLKEAPKETEDCSDQGATRSPHPPSTEKGPPPSTEDERLPSTTEHEVSRAGHAGEQFSDHSLRVDSAWTEEEDLPSRTELETVRIAQSVERSTRAEGTWTEEDLPANNAGETSAGTDQSADEVDHRRPGIWTEESVPLGLDYAGNLQHLEDDGNCYRATNTDSVIGSDEEPTRLND